MANSAPLTSRSRMLMELLPAIQGGVSFCRMRAQYAEEAFQQTFIAVAPHLDRLAAMPEEKRRAYAYRAGIRTAMALRKQIGLEQARGTDEEVHAWERHILQRTGTPEEIVRAAEGAERVNEAFCTLDSSDQKLITAINLEGRPERDVAAELGIPRASIGYRVRRACAILEDAWRGTTS